VHSARAHDASATAGRFQRKGWTETQVLVRVWLIGAMLAAMALAKVELR